MAKKHDWGDIKIDSGCSIDEILVIENTQIHVRLFNGISEWQTISERRFVPLHCGANNTNTGNLNRLHRVNLAMTQE